MKTLLISSLFMLSATALAQDLFVIKKSMNPKNVLHFKAAVESCKLKNPGVTAYWIMGEKDGHQEGLLSNELPYFAPKISYSKETEADFSIGAMEKMGSKIPDKSIRVRLEDCKPKAFIELNGQEIQLTEIYVSVNLFMSVKYMTIAGIAPNGEKVSHRIEN
jgi:hypothetical protein